MELRKLECWKKSWPLCCGFLLWLSCSHTAFKNSVSKPQWIEHMQGECLQNEFCAVGMGASEEEAQMRAKENLAQIFEVQVTSSMQNRHNYTQEENLDNDQSTVWEKKASAFNYSIDILAQEILNGVQITDRYREGDHFYVLVELNKKQAAARLQRQMENIDEQMVVLSKRKSMKNFHKAQSRFLMREKLNQRFHVLSGDFLAEVISWKQIADLKNIDEKEQKKVFLQLSEGELAAEIEQMISEILANNGLKVVGKNIVHKGQNILTCEGVFNMQEMFLKVEGFKALILGLKILLRDRHGDIVKTLTLSLSASERTYDKVKQSLVRMLQKELTDKMDDWE